MGATGAIQYLTKPHQYAQVYARGSAHYSDLVVLRATPSGLPFTRCGFSVGKKVGKAVVRNKVKRRLREIARLTPIKSGWDIVLIARPGAAAASYADLDRATADLLGRARLLDGQGSPGTP